MNAARDVYEHYAEDYYRSNKKTPPTFEDFVIGSMLGATKKIDYTETRSLIEATLFDSYRWIEFGEYDRSNGAMAMAKLLYKRHQLKMAKKGG